MRVLGGLHEQVDGIIDRLADQRGAETQRQPMYRAAKTQADRGHPGQRARYHRHQPEQQRGHRAVHQQQQRDDQADAQRGQALHFTLDGVAGADREHARAGHHEAVSLGVGLCLPRLPEGLADGGDGVRLAVGVRASAGGLRQQHGALAVARDPSAVAQRHALVAVELAQHGRDFASGVAWQ